MTPTEDLTTRAASPSLPGLFGTLFALGFRPFFLAAGVWAVLSLALWLAMLHGLIPMNRYYTGTTWHGHEMLFGYTAAVIAGFLLTASRNWTGMATASGAELGALVWLWIAGRVAPLLPLPGVLVAVLDLSFPLLLALSLRGPLWQGPERANRVFLLLLGGMGLASLLVHLEALGITSHTALAGDRLMLGMTLLTFLVVAGRIMPFFTQAAVRGASPRATPWVERLTFGLGILWVATDVAARLTPWPVGDLAGAMAFGFALVQALRLVGWHDRRVWGVPILAVLYSGYLWLILGLVLNGLAHFGHLADFPALHALTVGTLGIFTLGMMGRVTQGHTGRLVEAAGMTVISYYCLTLAAATRVLGPLVWPTAYGPFLMVSGALWVLAFLLFLWVHAPMLVNPRVDGKPG